MNQKWILFDLDDTLIDHSYAQEKAIETFYLSHSDTFNISSPEFKALWHELVSRFFGLYAKKILTIEEARYLRMQELFLHFHVKLSPAEASQKFRDFIYHYRNNWRPIPGAISVLKELSKKYPIGLITNGDHRTQTKKLKHIKALHYFDVCFFAGDLPWSKPSPHLFHFVKRTLGVKSFSQICYIGDQFQEDYLASKYVGVQSFWFSKKHTFIRPAQTVRQLEKLQKIFKYV